MFLENKQHECVKDVNTRIFFLLSVLRKLNFSIETNFRPIKLVLLLRKMFYVTFLSVDMNKYLNFKFRVIYSSLLYTGSFLR